MLMFVNISPAVFNMGETICSLNFASRCRSVELGQAKRQSDETSLKRGAALEGSISAMSPGTTVTHSRIAGRSSLGPGSLAPKK